MSKDKATHLDRLRAVMTAAALAFSTFAAGSALALDPPDLGVEFRMDAEYKDNDDSHDLNKSRPTLLFKLQRAHFNLKGVLDDDVSYRMRLSWNRSFEPEADESSPALELLYVRYKFDDLVQFRFGKQFVVQGGVEGSHNPIDVLGHSLVGRAVQDLYNVGASVLYTLGQNSTLVGQMVNQPGGGSEYQFAPGLNVAWTGELANGMVAPVVQYAVFPHAAEREAGSGGSGELQREEYEEFYISLGTHVYLDELKVELDLLKHSTGEYRERRDGEVVAIDSRDETSLIFLIRQEHPRLAPYLKWINDTVVQDGLSLEEEISSNEFQVGAEYHPKPDRQNFRLHGFVGQRTVEQEDGSFTELRGVVGITARFE